jgi:prophage regulatory protein
MQHDYPKIFRFNDLKILLKVSRSTIDRWEKAGSFPKRIILGENSIGWRSTDISNWIDSRRFK